MDELGFYGRTYKGLKAFGRYSIEARVKEQRDEINDEIGVASIFGFPYRMYGDENLSSLIGEDGGYRYKVHPPISVKYPGAFNTASTSTIVPFEQWPSFEWSTNISQEDHKSPVFNMGQMPIQASIDYNGMRIDVWGPNCRTEMDSFSRRFFEWLRVLTNQSWINSYESHHDSSSKFRFSIDELGRAIEQPRGIFEFTAHAFFSLTNVIWKEAFKKAINIEEPPLYWTIFLNAYNSYAEQSLWECVLYMTLSLEIARNIHYRRFCKYTTKDGVVKFKNRSCLKRGHLT